MAITFKNLFQSTQAGLAAAPDRTVVPFTAETRQAEGLRSTVAIRQFTLGVDEPTSLGGTDTAPNPVEYVLAALGTCQEITYRLYADAMGIPLTNVSVKVTGTIDLRGFFAVDPTVRPGFQEIRATVTLDSPASDAELHRLREAVDRHCPVLDILRNPTPVSLDLAVVDTAALAPAE